MSEQTLTGRTLGDYAILRLVGKGAGGSVYRARRETAGPGGGAGAVVALKVFHPDLVADERAFARFEREAEVGQRIRHPHVVPTYDHGKAEIDGTTLHYMAMEFVEGQTLRELLEELRVVPEDLLYQIADQALDALSAIHAAGMIHRDLKPENVVITHDQQVRVMDLGVARLQQEGRDLTLAGEFIGSLAYAAPEQFTDQDHVDPRADLYALGVVLYEMATGVNPYDEPNLRALIEKKLRLPVRRPRLVNRDVDPFLDEVIGTCLAVSPAERFPSCTELRAVLRARERGPWWQGRIAGETFPAATRALRRLRPEREAPLVAREAPLRELHEAFEAVRGGVGGVAFVIAPAGMGKSRLVHDFLEDLVAPDGPVLLAGRCPAEGGHAHHPFLEALAGWLGEDAEGGEQLATLLAADADVPGALASFVRARAAERPVVLVVEDLQRADAGTLSSFRHLAHAMAEQPALLVATWRPEEVGEGSPLGGVATALAAQPGCRRVVLPPWEREGVEAVLASLVRVPRTVRALGWPLTRASAGNPRLLLALVEHLREDGTLVEGEGGWIATAPVTEVGLPESVRPLLLVRLVGVEPALLELLEAASAQGPEFDAGLLATITGAKRLRLLKQLAVLERKHGLVRGAGRDAFRFASHGLWQVVHAGTPPERRRAWHARCADGVRAGGEPLAGEAAFAWVGHMLEAERIADALDAIPAAVRHADTHVHATRALGFLERLDAALPPGHAALRLDLALRRAALQRRLGEPDAERRALEEASREAERLGAPGPRGRVAGERAAQALRRGEAGEARALAEEALARGAQAGEEGVRARALQVLGEVASRAGAFAESASHARAALETWRSLGDEAGAASAALQLGRVLPEVGGQEEALALQEEALQTLRRIGDRRGEAAALDAVGLALVEAGQAARAHGSFAEALAIARELGDLPAEAATLRHQARIFGIESRIEEARAAFEQALSVARQLGDPAAEAAVHDELGALLAAYGELAPALDSLGRAREAAERLGHRAMLARVLRHLAAVLHEAGETEEAWRAYDRALELAPPSARAATLADMAAAALRGQDPERAADLAERALESAEDGPRRIVALARLARARQEGGRSATARAAAEQLEGEILAAGGAVPPRHGPEVYYCLATVLAGDEHAVAYLRKANELLAARTSAIRSVAWREHYLTSRWPNREILVEVRALES